MATARSKRGWRLFTVAVVTALVAGLAAGVYAVASRPVVEVVEVATGPVVLAFYATGTLEPLREYAIRSHVDGVLVEVLVDKGQAVAAGELLAQVRSDEFEMRYRQAEAEYAMRHELASEAGSPVLSEFAAQIRAALEQLEIAQNEVARLRALEQIDLAVARELDVAREREVDVQSRIDALRAQLAARRIELARDEQVAASALDIARWNVERQRITSPIDGVVLDRPLAAGTRVRTTDDLMRVADVAPERLVMRAAVDEEDKTRLSVGQRVLITLYAYRERVFEGRVQTIYPQADRARRTYEVDVAIEFDAAMSAGMTGELAFIVEERERALVIPSQAVQAGAVWVVRSGRLERVQATLGLRSLERTEVLDGLRAGERVVVSAASDLGAGRKVRPRLVQPAGRAADEKPRPINLRGM